MNYRENFRYFLCFGIVFFIAYTFIAVKPLNTEYHFEPQSAVDLSAQLNANAGAPDETALPNNSANEAAAFTNKEEASLDGDTNTDSALFAHKTDEKLIPFRLKNRVGYLTQNGDVALLKDFSYKATACDCAWATYDASSTAVNVFAPDGSALTVIDESGFPFFQDERLYLLPPGGNAVSRFDHSGKRMWLYEGFTPITAFNSSAIGAVLGFADGNLVFLTADGNEKFSFYPGGSNYQIIFGADVASTQNLVACISGIDKQRFLLTSFSENRHKVIYHEYFETQNRSTAFVRFTQDSRFVYFQCGENLGIVNAETTKCVHLPIKGTICQLKEIPELNVSLVLTHENETYRVYFVENNDRLNGDFEFAAKSAFIATTGTTVFVGSDDIVSKMAISRK